MKPSLYLPLLSSALLLPLAAFAAGDAHDEALIETLAIGLGFAFVGGFIAFRLGLPPLIGYLVAGVSVGPFTPGLIVDATIAPQLAEIGVILLMFGVGMHFSIRDLMRVRRIAVPGAIAQIALATAMGIGLAEFWGWTLGGGIVLGLALSVASTVVLLKALEARGMLQSEDGQIAIGWLIVEDLVMVLALVLLPALAGPLRGEALDLNALLRSLGLTLAMIALFVVLMLVVGKRVFPWLLARVEKSGSAELFTLAAITLSLGVAFISAELFGVSFALGAFFAGIVVNESDHSHRAADELRPFQDAFAALFFVSVGMLFDPMIVVTAPLSLLAVVAVIVIGKSVVAYAIVRVLGWSNGTALNVSAALAQIGEFSFILIGLGLTLELVPKQAQGLVVAGALISIAVNPLVLRLTTRFR
ncbi:cation:proton antiporter domain-containing protein [Nevskia ramosa]|uniref:cation:proton antiporter domain-containing protein n=1 Tax=Nevskia ramosa TaxID=64002 RepID=UPI0003B7496D|nr:cation:proton antiporter [Nevskia ramosa]